MATKKFQAQIAIFCHAGGSAEWLHKSHFQGRPWRSLCAGPAAARVLRFGSPVGFAAWESAFYFSACSDTTVGNGDVVLPSNWRMLRSAWEHHRRVAAEYPLGNLKLAQKLSRWPQTSTPTLLRHWTKLRNCCGLTR